MPFADGKVASLKKEIAAGAEASLDLPGGPGAVRALELRLETADAKERERAPRSVIVKLTFDYKTTAWVPATDFFGTGAGINALNSWYRNVSTEGAMRLPVGHALFQVRARDPRKPRRAAGEGHAGGHDVAVEVG